MRTVMKMDETSNGLELSIYKDIDDLAILTAFIGLMDVMIVNGNEDNIVKLLTKAYEEAKNAADTTVS